MQFVVGSGKHSIWIMILYLDQPAESQFIINCNIVNRVLLDEINLASSETLERLCGLLDDAQGSVTLTEKGDSEALKRHPNFRIFAAMNPATDAGKKDLPSSLRSRFTEIYVDELIDEVELRSVAAR